MAEDLGQELREHHEHHEHANHGHDDAQAGAAHKHRIRCTLLASIFVIISMLIGLQAEHASTKAMLNSIEASDQWAYFNTKGTRENVAEGFLSVFEKLGPGLAVDQADVSKTIVKYRADVAKYQHQKDEIQAEARHLKAEAVAELKFHDKLKMALQAFGVASVLAMIAGSVVALGMLFFWGSLGMGAIGTILALLAFLG